jgi:hypothetical protein
VNTVFWITLIDVCFIEALLIYKISLKEYLVDKEPA